MHVCVCVCVCVRACVRASTFLSIAAGYMAKKSGVLNPGREKSNLASIGQRNLFRIDWFQITASNSISAINYRSRKLCGSLTRRCVSV